MIINKSVKKIIALVTVLSICIASFSISAFGASDISGHWASEAIQEWLDKGLANGYPDGSFKPNENITRAEFMSLVNKSFDFTAEEEISYSDVSESKWYYNVVKATKAAGYLTGYPDGTIKPEELITRQEAAVIIAAVKGLESNVNGANDLTDATEMASWSKGAIGAVVEAGYMSGYKDKTFKASNYIKRGEVITVLKKAVETQEVSGKVTVSAGTADLTKVRVQLKKNGTDFGKAVKATADGTYTFSDVNVGSNYTVTASLEGYYDFTTAAFSVVDGSDVTKNIQVARKEPIITTQTLTTVSKGTEGFSVVIDLSTGRDYEAEITNFGHKFAEESIVTNADNWVINTGVTGFTLDSIVRNNDTKVTINFTGTATKARAFDMQAKAAAITGTNVYDSNILTFSVVEDSLITSSVPDLKTYYTKNVDVDNMKAVVVIVHGLAEHLGRYNEVAEELNKAGYGVYRLDNQGHGLTAEANGADYTGYVEDFNQYHKDIDKVVDMAIAENPNQKVYMLGHSMGGLLTSQYGVTYTDKLAGQIISGGATGPYYLFFGTDEQAFYGDGGPRTSVPNSLTSTVCRYPAVSSYYYVDPLRLTEYTAKLRWETFGEGSKYLADRMANYSYPVFILHGEDDRIVNKSASESLYNTIASTDKTLKIYPGLYHESLNERNEKSMVIEDIIAWLDARI